MGSHDNLIVTADDSNYLPDLDAQADCAFKSVGFSGKVLGICETFTSSRSPVALRRWRRKGR